MLESEFQIGNAGSDVSAASRQICFNAGMKVLDKDGNGYYTSFPPFAVIAPYLVLALFSLDVTVLNLQLFNLAGHLCGTLLIFFTLDRVLSHGPSPRTAAAVGAVTYIFLAPNLWYGANVYSWDTFWHYLWIAGRWVFT